MIFSSEKIRRNVVIAAFVMILIIGYLFINCPVRFIFGIPCPGCGLTRAWSLVLQGNITDAFFCLLLFLLILPLIGLIIIDNFYLHYKIAAFSIIIYGLAALFFGVYIVRFIILFPHIAPMDYYDDAILLKLINSITQR
jgi:hypothetical protein